MNMVHISQIDLNLFVVLDAIFTEGGVTRASRKLNLTQPAISHALNRLRQMFDDPLFVRQGHGLVPTPLARNIIEPVRRSLRALEITLNETGHFDPRVTQKRFTLGLRDILEATVLPLLMQRIGEAGPLIDIASIRADRRTLEAGLAAGRVDVAMDVLLPLSDDIRRQRVEMERLAVVARRDHPEVGEDLDLATYLRQHHVMVTSRQRGPGLEDVALSRLGLQRRIRLRCQHYFAACRVASRTNLILTMPERYASIVNQQFGNQVLPLPLDAQTIEVYIYWHAAVENDPANHWLRTELIQAFQAEEALLGP
jgi:DNA-binding transcriptional LysR family regulator